MNILGLSGLAHDSAAALLSDAGAIAAMEESKLVRMRTAAGIPREAIRFCLERAGTGWAGVECVAVASRPLRAWVRQAWMRAKLTPFAPVPSGYYQTKALGELGRELNNGRLLQALGESPDLRVLHLEHHLCHAASAFYASDADRALVLTLDEQGDGRSGSIALGEGQRLGVLETIPFPHSPAWIFSQVTDLIGFTPHADEHKTQWLALEGDPAFESLFLELLRRAPGKLPHLAARYFNPGLAGHIAFSPKFYRAVGVDAAIGKAAETGSPRPPIPEVLRKQLAASVQQACCAVAAELAERYRKQTGAKSLCLAGGLFLNPVVVSHVERNTGFEHVFVQPAAGNEGTALGAAWYVRHHMQGKKREAAVEKLDWGPFYSNQDIKQILDNCKARYRFHASDEQRLEETIQLLAAGKIVGWFHGAAEFGPRALGNRSLLASPWAAYVKENLNEYVKHREAFRPFAISIIAERAAEYFDYTPSARFMATLGFAKKEAAQVLDGFLLPGGRVRLHVVEKTANPLLWRLLERFGQFAPAPMLVNTSFNLFGEPLVVAPRDAVRSYFCSGVDALVIGNFTLAKN
ncbi:MAG TPA: carbamoyltransferase C-terminal domain-containing protein [Candidatus Acidoferrales bacterium]|nr:carbamoyltransferase C-terminal domain-containing protein [Candidatus Acidoferrales bacterium]